MNFIGVDLHKKSITVCVMDEKRKVLARKILACTQTNEIVDVETGTQLVIDSSCVPVSFPWPRRGSTRATRTRTRSWLMAAIPSPGNRSRGERGWKQRVWDLLPARGEPGRPRRAIAGRRDSLDPLACRRIVSLRDPETLEEPTPMKPELYQRVALRRDVADHRLMRGDVAVLVDRVPHPSGGEPGVVLEVFNAIGESLSVVAVKESDIGPLR